MLAAMEPGNYWQWEALRLWWLRTLMAVMKWCIGLPQEKQTCLYLWNSCNSILLELDLRSISQKCCVLSLNIQRILSTSIPRATGLMWCSVHTGIFRAQRSALSAADHLAPCLGVSLQTSLWNLQWCHSRLNLDYPTTTSLSWTPTPALKRRGTQ